MASWVDESPCELKCRFAVSTTSKFSVLDVAEQATMEGAKTDDVVMTDAVASADGGTKAEKSGSQKRRVGGGKQGSTSASSAGKGAGESYAAPAKKGKMGW